jgi:hypothetical protein
MENADTATTTTSSGNVPSAETAGALPDGEASGATGGSSADDPEHNILPPENDTATTASELAPANDNSPAPSAMAI